MLRNVHVIYIAAQRETIRLLYEDINEMIIYSIVVIDGVIL